MAHMIAADIMVASEADVSELCAKLRAPSPAITVWPTTAGRKAAPHFALFDGRTGALADEAAFVGKVRAMAAADGDDNSAPMPTAQSAAQKWADAQRQIVDGTKQGTQADNMTQYGWNASRGAHDGQV